MEKYYWFSTSKHAHDIEFRYNRVSNEIADMQYNAKEVPDQMYELQDKLDELRSYMCGACGQPVKIPASLYDLAMETVLWAAEARSKH